ncbi:MAG: hypothetical protein ABFD83_08305 [Armatimonadota bacterium]
MTSFSERYGYKPVRDILQLETMDELLKTRLWNVIYNELTTWHTMPGNSPHTQKKQKECLYHIKSLWCDFLCKPANKMPIREEQFWFELNEWFSRASWYEIYDLIEALALRTSLLFQKRCNEALEKEMAGYRLVDKQIAPITNEEELTSVQNALSNEPLFEGARHHLKSALELLSNRENPDYRNSIKESISAIESACRVITGDHKAELGKALDMLDNKLKIHGALKSGFKSLYGYTSDEGGIRHAMLEQPDLNQEDALYMLVTCSAFLNYLAAKSEKANSATSQLNVGI